MGKIKSLITKAEFDVVGKRHQCKANVLHTLEKGDDRLTIYEGRKTSHYCLNCAKKILETDLRKLENLMKESDRFLSNNKNSETVL